MTLPSLFCLLDHLFHVCPSMADAEIQRKWLIFESIGSEAEAATVFQRQGHSGLFPFTSTNNAFRYFCQ